MWAYIQAHSTVIGLGAYWVFSAAVSAMPEPTGNNAGYAWLYGFAHTIAGNLSTVLGTKGGLHG